MGPVRNLTTFSFAQTLSKLSLKRPQVHEEEEIVEEENGSGDELDLDQVEEEMAAQYGSDDDEYESSNLFNINVQTITPHVNQIRGEVLESQGDVEAWKAEVERVIPRLKLAMKPGNDSLYLPYQTN